LLGVKHSIACKQLTSALAQVLLGADPPASLGLVNDWGLTAVALAAVKGHSEPRDALIAAGGTAAGLHTFYPLHAAAITGDAGELPMHCPSAPSAAQWQQPARLTLLPDTHAVGKYASCARGLS
jgi:hypothetical protein